MLKPKRLERKSLVALVNPTGKIPEKFSSQEDYSFEYLKKGGYNPKKFLVNSEALKEERAEIFNSAIKSCAKALFPVGNSKGATDILNLIDYEEFSKNKPLFIGFSSLSTLLAKINQESNVIVFYGPHMVFLNDKSSFRENKYTIASFWNILTGDSYAKNLGSELSDKIFRSGNEKLGLKNIHYYIPEIDEEIKFEGYESGFAHGKILASSLEGLEELSELEYNLKNKIVIVDSVEINFDEAFCKINKIKEKTNALEMSALIVASLKSRSDKKDSKLLPELKNDSKRKEFVMSLRKMFKNNIPILYGFPSGHGRYKLTIPIGIESTLDLKSGDIYFKESIWD